MILRRFTGTFAFTSTYNTRVHGIELNALNYLEIELNYTNNNSEIFSKILLNILKIVFKIYFKFPVNFIQESFTVMSTNFSKIFLKNLVKISIKFYLTES